MFKPLEFVTNKLTGNRASAMSRMAQRPPVKAGKDIIDDDSSDSDSESNSNHRVRFLLPSSDSNSDEELTDSQFFVLRKEDPKERGVGGGGGKRTSPRNKSTGLEELSASTAKEKPTQTSPLAVVAKKNPRKTKTSEKTPSPKRTITKKVSPPTNTTGDAESLDKESSLLDDTNSRDGEEAILGTGKNKGKKSPNSNTKSKGTKSSEKTSSPPRTATAAGGVLVENTKSPESVKNGSVTPTPQKKKKKRLSVYEQLHEDAQNASEAWKEDTEKSLRFKRQLHKEKLREIREREEEIKKMGDQLKKLRENASDLEKLIKEDVEKKKLAAKLGNILKRTTQRAVSRALKDKEDAKANIKAKDAVLKQALKDNQKKRRRSEEDEEDAEGAKGSAKKKRKVSPKKKKKRSARKGQDSDESSESSECESENESDSDDDDSDWEGAPSRKKKKNSGSDSTEIEDLGDRRQTRVRSSCWTCSKCTLENDTKDNECAVCGEIRPGYVPDFE